MMLRRLYESPFVRFAVVGGVATAVNYAVYVVLVRCFDNLWPALAYFCAFCVSIVCNFLLSSYFTFRVRPSARRAVRFAVVTVADLAGLAGRSGGVSPAIVGRVGEFLFDPLDEGFGRLRGRRMGKADDEPAAADDFFAAVQVFWGQIRDEIGDRHGNKV